LQFKLVHLRYVHLVRLLAAPVNLENIKRFAMFPANSRSVVHRHKTHFSEDARLCSKRRLTSGLAAKIQALLNWLLQFRFLDEFPEDLVANINNEKLPWTEYI
jgi:hypothetical protein